MARATSSDFNQVQSSTVSPSNNDVQNDDDLRASSTAADAKSIAKKTTSPVLSSHVAAASTLSVVSADSSIMPSDSKSVAASVVNTPHAEDLDDALKEALSNADARPFVIDLARQIEDFLTFDTEGRLQVVTATSYQRMLVYRSASFYNLLVESESPKMISLYRSSTSFLPSVRLEEMYPGPEEAPKPNYQLLKRQMPMKPVNNARQASSDVDARSDAGTSTHSSNSRKTHAQSIQEREAAYKAARMRIFEGFDDTLEAPVASSSTSRQSDVDDQDGFRRYPLNGPYVDSNHYAHGPGPGPMPYQPMPYGVPPGYDGPYDTNIPYGMPGPIPQYNIWPGMHHNVAPYGPLYGYHPGYVPPLLPYNPNFGGMNSYMPKQPDGWATQIPQGAPHSQHAPPTPPDPAHEMAHTGSPLAMQEPVKVRSHPQTSSTQSLQTQTPGQGQTQTPERTQSQPIQAHQHNPDTPAPNVHSTQPKPNWASVVAGRGHH